MSSSDAIVMTCNVGQLEMSFLDYPELQSERVGRPVLDADLIRPLRISPLKHSVRSLLEPWLVVAGRPQSLTHGFHADSGNLVRLDDLGWPTSTEASKSGRSCERERCIGRPA